MKHWSALLGAAIGAALIMPMLGPSAEAQGRVRLESGATDTVPGLTKNPLTATQGAEVARIRTDTRRRIAEVRANANLTATERQSRVNEIRAEGHQRVMNTLTPEQRAESQQRWSGSPMAGRRWNNNASGRGERGGVRARPSARVGRPGAGMGARAMGPMTGVPGLVKNPLTAEQSDRVNAIRREGRDRMRSLRTGMNLTAEQRQARVDEERSRIHSKVMGVLTPQQRAEFQQWWRDSSAAS